MAESFLVAMAAGAAYILACSLIGRFLRGAAKAQFTETV